MVIKSPGLLVGLIRRLHNLSSATANKSPVLHHGWLRSTVFSRFIVWIKPPAQFQPSPFPDVTGWGCRAAVNMFPGLESALPGLPGAPWLSKAAEEAVSVRGL